MRNLDERAWAYLGATVNGDVEVACLRAGADPAWERPHREGVDITDQPELQTPYQQARRASYEARVAGYRERGLI